MKKTWIIPAGVLGVSALQLLTLHGLIRRVEGLESRLQGSYSPQEPPISLAVGDHIPDLGSDAPEADQIGRPTVYGFFSPQCEACHAQVLPFKELHATGDVATHAFVMEDGGDTSELEQLLAPVPVVVASFDGSIADKFKPSAFPTFVTATAAGVVVAVGYKAPTPSAVTSQA